jgi:predicted ATPase/DNA-binding CsgD family transcriptional regulator
MAVKPPPNATQPTRLTHFIGRKNDLQRLTDIILDPSVHLITILGRGGIGKTSLALELAGKLRNEFPQGIHFIPLAQLNSTDALLPAIAEKLGVISPPGGNFKEAVVEYLSNRQALLILDNFEHLLEGSFLVRDLLAAGPRVKAIVTAREKLDLEAETLYRLSGLELSPTNVFSTAEQYEAVQLFLQKARQVRPGFSLDNGNVEAVNQLCQVVDGSPLGILLEAAWIEHFSPAEILQGVRNNLDFLSRATRDAESRHASMRAVFNPSLERLNDNQKKVFRRLAYFRGGFDLAAAAAVAGGDLPALIALVEKSLLARDAESGRYEMHELLRQYAHEELEAAGESRSTLEAHMGYYRAFIQAREAELISASQTKALDEIQADFDNIRQSFTAGVGNRDFNTVRSMVPGIYKFCDMRSRAYEGEALFRQARDGMAPQIGEAPQPAWALALLSWYDLRTYGQPFESFEEIPTWAQSCLEYAQSINDPQATAASLVLLGAFSEDANDFKIAIRHYKKAMRIYPTLDYEYWVTIRIGLCHLSAKQYLEAIKAFQESLRRGKETGERLKQAWALVNMGDTLLCQENPKEARGRLEQAYALFQEIGNKFGLVWSNFSLGKVAIEMGDVTSAREHAKIAGNLAKELHALTWVEKVNALLLDLKPEYSQATKSAKGAEGEVLSQREMEILQLLKSELNGPEIADRLTVSLNTVRFHTKNIYQKLGVNNRLEAIRRAKELGL